MSYQPVDVIEVVVWGRPVGAVARNPATGNYAFEYTPDWVRGGVELAPLHMPLEPTVYEFPGLAQGTFHRLPPLLADSLPGRAKSLDRGAVVGVGWRREAGVFLRD